MDKGLGRREFVPRLGLLFATALGFGCGEQYEMTNSERSQLVQLGIGVIKDMVQENSEACMNESACHPAEEVSPARLVLGQAVANAWLDFDPSKYRSQKEAILHFLQVLNTEIGLADEFVSSVHFDYPEDEMSITISVSYSECGDKVILGNLSWETTSENVDGERRTLGRPVIESGDENNLLSCPHFGFKPFPEMFVNGAPCIGNHCYS